MTPNRDMNAAMIAAAISRERATRWAPLPAPSRPSALPADDGPLVALFVAHEKKALLGMEGASLRLASAWRSEVLRRETENASRLRVVLWALALFARCQGDRGAADLQDWISSTYGLADGIALVTHADRYLYERRAEVVTMRLDVMSLAVRFAPSRVPKATAARFALANDGPVDAWSPDDYRDEAPS